MEDSFSQEVRPYLDLIDQLREKGLNKELSLPQIVVMGDQSSGKSSVLESISGIPFPRGTGLVTKSPLELIMKKSPPGSPWKADISIRWNKVQPKESGEVFSITELQEKILVISEIISNGLNGFSSDCIIIKVSSEDSPDLTLIDLPGIIRTSTAGQDTSVINQVNQLIEKYINLQNTIILAVIPSNQDIATIDILERAAKADPSGQRTIGVLTKPDLIGPGNESEALEVLLNKRKPLKLGYIMVKNNSQKQLNEGLSYLEARRDEESFFKDHPYFSKYYDQNIFGTFFLTKRLTFLLVDHIKMSLPQITREVRELLTKHKEELNNLGEQLPSNNNELHSLIVKKLSLYCTVLRQSSRGEYRDKTKILSSNADLRLHVNMTSAFKAMQDQLLKLRPDFNDNNDLYIQLEEEIFSQRGRDLPGFINTHLFTSTIVNLVESWRSSIESCAAEVVQSTSSIALGVSFRIFEAYPLLKTYIDQLTSDLVESLNIKLREDLDTLIIREQDPFTTQEQLLEVVNSIRFRNFDNALRQILDSVDSQVVNQQNKYALEEDVRLRLGHWYMRRHGVDSMGNKQELITLIQAYWDIASRRLIDNVCMCIEKEFLAGFINELETQSTLFGISLQEEQVVNYLHEAKEILERRNDLQDRIQTLQTSFELLLVK